MDVMTANGIAQGMGVASEAAAGAATSIVRSLGGTSPENGGAKLVAIWVLGPLMIWAAGRDHMPEWSRSALVGAGILAIFWNALEWNRAEYVEEGYRRAVAEQRERSQEPTQVVFDRPHNEWGA